MLRNKEAETHVLPLTVDRESPYPVHWAPFDGLAHVGSEVSVTFNAAIRAAEPRGARGRRGGSPLFL